ncbi:hypothetical protein FJM67_08095 [Maribrevibacterium harenarium]|uniref:ABC transporter permease n=1 Tax=Maribrevibacterium harenarium TaxID=2589817 RepID=A0A501WVF3_9GAMM|nr:ABC transporter permease subunit [Maribrevibacterium harenarium]TPE52390.1 hypothetical protein FJM67_08095 [Maribrevibacterium harenarium]
MAIFTSRASLIASQSVAQTIQLGTIKIITGIFVGLILLSAYLGYSATSTVNAIYADAVIYLQASGQPVPPNPAQLDSPLGMLRNMTIYISLIGSLAAMVIGHQLIASDRKQGVLPLIGTRIESRSDYLDGKIKALLTLLGGVTGIAAFVAAITLILLPSVVLTSAMWGQLVAFMACAYLILLFFGLLALASTALVAKESVALLLPVTLWITLTFIFPSLSANIHPTAAINPISSLAATPDNAFFHFSQQFLAPFSTVESFKSLSAYWLDYSPNGSVFPTGALMQMVVSVVIAAGAAWYGLTHISLERGEFDV